MTNNDVLRRVRYIFDYNDDKMIKIFGNGGLQSNREEVTNFLKKDDDPQYTELSDFKLASFLNGFIVEKRGKKDGEEPVAEKTLNNNLILRKLTIACSLKSEDVVDVLKLADLRISKHEVSAFFRKPGHKNFRECKDQFLRNFLAGLQIKIRG